MLTSMNIAGFLKVARQSSRAASSLVGLKSLVDTVEDPGSVRCVLITHVLHTAVEYVELVNQAFPVEAIVAVPYSADLAAVEELRRRGFTVSVPDDVPDTFTQAVAETTRALEASETPLVVQEVGGYLAKATKQLAAQHAHFVGVVEDTNNGHWRYEQHGPHPVPVLSMAQSPLKDVEDTIIGDAVVYSVERIFREDYASILQGLRCGVIGFGKIGTSTAIGLRGREAVVSVYDINPAKNMRARVEGFHPLPLHALLPQADLVVGCTGQTSIRLIDMEHIKDGAILVSASSKDIEFALDDFKSACTAFEEQAPHIWTLTQKNGKSFSVLNAGTPVNFRDKSILGTILDMIYCELFVCMRTVAAGKAPTGLTHSPPVIQDEVAKTWLRAHSPTFADHPDDKVWDYPESLDLGRPKK